MAINGRKSDDMKTTFAVSKEKASASVKVTVLAVVVTIPMAFATLYFTHIRNCLLRKLTAKEQSRLKLAVHVSLSVIFLSQSLDCFLIYLISGIERNVLNCFFIFVNRISKLF